MNLASATPTGAVEFTTAGWLTRRRAFVFLGAYFLLHTVLRTLVSSSAELDESQQLLWTQAWQWGYGSDPPLYTWLQILIFQVFGGSIFGLALLKNALLFGTFLFTYFATEELTRDEPTSALAMVSLLLFPQIAWESQRDLTHSVLATAAAAGSFWVAVRLLNTRAPGTYLLLGLCIGLGTLSKYSYGLFVLALLLAGLTVPRVRQAMASKWILLGLAGFALVTALHFRWVVLSPAEAFNRAEQLARSAPGSGWKAWMQGLASLVRCAFMIAGALTAAYWFAFRGMPAGRARDDLAFFGQWMRRSVLVILAMSVVIVGITWIEMRDRWYQPMVCLLAIWAAVWMRPRLLPQAEKRFAWVILSAGLAVLLILPAIPLAAAVTRRPTRLNSPCAALSQQLKRTVPNPSGIIAATRLVGGNLRLSFSGAVVIEPEFDDLALPANGSWLVAWDASKVTPPPPPLVELVRRRHGSNLSSMTPSFVEAEYQYTHRKTMKLGYVVLPAKSP